VPPSAGAAAPPRVEDELDVLSGWVPLARQDIVEAGCGDAALARRLLARHPDCRVTGLDVDLRQLGRNLANPLPGLRFVAAGAQAMPFEDSCFDLALMLKSLHHVPRPFMAQALGELARVLRPGGLLYVSEPVYAGPFNDVMRLFNDEGVVRAAAQSALDAAVISGRWAQVAEQRFEVSVRFAGFADFEQRMMRPSFADHRIDEATLAAVRAAFEPHMRDGGARFDRPMHVRLLRRLA
jgi:SAM-dependent methyltransferase